MYVTDNKTLRLNHLGCVLNLIDQEVKKHGRNVPKTPGILYIGVMNSAQREPRGTKWNPLSSSSVFLCNIEGFMELFSNTYKCKNVNDLM